MWFITIYVFFMLALGRDGDGPGLTGCIDSSGERFTEKCFPPQPPKKKKDEKPKKKGPPGGKGPKPWCPWEAPLPGGPCACEFICDFGTECCCESGDCGKAYACVGEEGDKKW